MPVAVDTNACTNCNWMLSGCRFDAKRSLLLNYLPRPRPTARTSVRCTRRRPSPRRRCPAIATPSATPSWTPTTTAVPRRLASSTPRSS
ncbi:hypothetical protein ACFQ51_38005 [Streptomyces kaempferi]